MTENYPTSIDSYATKTDNVTDVMADDVNTMQVAVVALQSKVGIDSSAVITSMDYILSDHVADATNPHSVTSTQVGLSAVENTALSTWAGTANITTLGTVVTGTWNATAIGWAKVDTTGSNLTDIATRSHTDLTDKGTNTHAQIDTHISSTSNPHTVTLEQARTGGNSISGDIDANSNKVVNLATPTADADAVRKDYVDGLISGLDWQESVKDEVNFVTSEPAAPSTGDRYINTTTGNSSITTQAVVANYVYEWNGSSWTETVPDEGFACWIEDIDALKVYNGANWVSFGSTMTHNNLSGLQGGAAGEYYHMTSANHTAATRDATNAQNGLMPTAKLTGWDAAYTHVSSDGTDHTYIDQDITNGSSPVFGTTKLTAVSELTIATGAITKSQTLHRIDTEGDAASDDLDTINGGSDGDFIIIRAENSARTVVLKDSTGNLDLWAGDIELDSTDKYIILTYDSTLTKWVIVGGAGLQLISDATYGAGWNGVTKRAASKNAIYDKIDTMDTAIALNTSKVTNATHSGEVTGATALTITDNIIDEANMKISNAPTNDHVLTADSAVTGGWKWAAAASGFADPTTTRGDMIFKDATNTTTRLGRGTNNQVLTSDGTDISWQDPTGVSPLTTKGDLYTFAAADTRLGVGYDGQYLRADSTQTTGLIWDTVSASDISDFDTEVGNNVDVAANTTHRGSNGSDHSYIDQAVTVAGTPTFASITLTNALTIANGGTNSNTALNNNRVMVSSTGSIIESATITTTELGLLNGKVSVSTGVGDNDKFVTQGYVDDADDTLTTAVGLNTTHRSSTGVDHTYINQNVTSTGTPSFAKTTITQTAIDGGYGFEVIRNMPAAHTNAPVATIIQESSIDDQHAFGIKNDGTGRGINIDQNGNGVGLYLDNAGTNDGIYVNQSSVCAASTSALEIYSNSNQIDSQGLVRFRQNNASSSQKVLAVENEGTGNGAFIDQDGNGIGMLIDTEATSVPGLQILADGIRTGTTTSSAFVVRQDHSSSTGTAAYIQNDGSGYGLYVDQNGNGNGIIIGSSATSYAALFINCEAVHTGTGLGAVFALRQDHSSSTGTVMQLQNDGSGYGLLIDQNGDGVALRADGQIYSTHQNQGTKTANYTVDWNKGNCQTVTAGGAFTLSFSNGKAGGSYTLILKQDATGSRTVTLPTVKWNDGDTAPTLSTGASDVDIMTFIYDGSVYYGSYSLDHS